MHTDNQKKYVSLAKEFQHHQTKEHHKNGVIDQGKYKKLLIKIIWTDREYHVQDNYYIAHQDVTMYCNTNQFL